MNSSHKFYNVQNADEQAKISQVLNEAKTVEERTLLWARLMEESHPMETMFCKGCYANFDYIFFTPGSMTVQKVLELPPHEAIS